MTRDELLAALKEAKGHSRKLDAQVAIYMNTGGLKPGATIEQYLEHVDVPHFTGSLTDAASLAGDFCWTLDRYPQNASAWVGPRDDPKRVFTAGATPSLALCGACVRAWNA